jgi:hypothetical protein
MATSRFEYSAGKVLERNPAHYGATFQLATALDRAGDAAEARPLWQKVLEMAEGYTPSASRRRCRGRLGPGRCQRAARVTVAGGESFALTRRSTRL